MLNLLKILCLFNIHYFQWLEMNGVETISYCKWCNKKRIERSKKQ